MMTSFFSCSNSLLVTPDDCNTKGTWSVSTKRDDFEVTKKVWASFGEKIVKVKDIIKKESLSCEQLGTISMRIEKTWGDAFWSLLPFFSRYTVTVSGLNIETVKDDLNAKGRREI